MIASMRASQLSRSGRVESQPVSATLRHGALAGPLSRALNTSRLPSRVAVSMEEAATVSETSREGVEERTQAAAIVPKLTSFQDLGVDELFKVGLKKLGADTPSTIQEAAIPHVLTGENVAIQSFTGSGKTLAFLLPILTLALHRAEKLYNEGQDVPLQAVIVAPGQELAMQIVRVAHSILPDEGRKLVQQCIGGANPHRQIEALRANKPLLVVGTPGRLADFVRSGKLKLHKCPVLALDEADQLLAPNFAEDMRHITEHCGKKLEENGLGARQTVLVSATLTKTVLSKSEKWCPSPVYVSAGGASPSLSPVTESDAEAPAPSAATPAWGWGVQGWDSPSSKLAPRTTGAAGGVEATDGLVPTMPPQLRHVYVVTEHRHKVDCLRKSINALNSQKSLVFMNFQQRLKDTIFKLKARKMAVGALHGEMGKLVRSNMLNDFRKGRLRSLIVSDVMARGMDINDCDVVFHLEMPSNAAHYAHRAGRTGRMGSEGTVISIVGRDEVFVVDKMARALGVPILEAHVAGGEFILGPPPFNANLRYDDDDDDDKKKKNRNKREKQKSGEENELAGSARAADSAGAEDSSGADLESKDRRVKSKQPSRTNKRDYDSDDSDGDDDDDDIDDEQLMRQVSAAGKRDRAAANTFSSEVADALKQELEELNKEKSAVLSDKNKHRR